MLSKIRNINPILSNINVDDIYKLPLSNLVISGTQTSNETFDSAKSGVTTSEA